MDTSSQWFQYLHNTRNLSTQVIEEAQLSEDLGRLRIPIFDQYGNELFAKLRRPQNSDAGPKYTYQLGASAALYGTNFKDLGGPIYFVEGELEVLAMRTMGLTAYSSTGGAMTFKEEWLGHVESGRDVVILFDNDETGMKGAIKLAMMIKKARFNWVPPRYGKDVGDLVTALGTGNARDILTDKERLVYFDVTASNVSEQKQVYKALCTTANRLDNSVGKQFLLQLAYNFKVKNKAQRKPKEYDDSEYAGLVERARDYPIENLLPVRPGQKLKCMWHDEDTGSLHLWKDNRLFCHGQCNKVYDAISVYMHLHDVKFHDAVMALNKL